MPQPDDSDWLMAVMGDYSLLRVLHPFYPNHQEIDDARLAFRRNLSSFGNFPPLFKTASAAGCRCVLSLENRMSAHGSLSSVVRRIRRRKACADEVGGMAPYRCHALSAIYFLSAAESLNRDRNFDLASFANASSTPIFHLAIISLF